MVCCNIVSWSAWASVRKRRGTLKVVVVVIVVEYNDIMIRTYTSDNRHFRFGLDNICNLHEPYFIQYVEKGCLIGQQYCSQPNKVPIKNLKAHFKIL